MTEPTTSDLAATVLYEIGVARYNRDGSPYEGKQEAFAALDALVARVDTLTREAQQTRDHWAEWENRARAAEAALADLRGQMEELREQGLWPVSKLADQLADTRRALEGFANHGTRFDTNPTVMIVNDEAWMRHHQWWVRRATDMDNAVRDRARRALAGDKP